MSIDDQIACVVPTVHQEDFRNYQFKNMIVFWSVPQLQLAYKKYLMLHHKIDFELFLQEQSIKWGCLEPEGQDDAVALYAEHLNKIRMAERKCAACDKAFQAPIEARAHTCPECVKLVQEGQKPKFNDAKQVILIRKDLQMPAGKLGAQVAHASLACILKMGKWTQEHFDGLMGSGVLSNDFTISLKPDIDSQDAAVHDWMTKSFPKITLEVKNEAQLKRYYDEAVAAGLPASWIVDAGRTVFNGVPTPTCVGIGPASRAQIDAITKRLRVYQ